MQKNMKTHVHPPGVGSGQSVCVRVRGSGSHRRFFLACQCAVTTYKIRIVLHIAQTRIQVFIRLLSFFIFWHIRRKCCLYFVAGRAHNIIRAILVLMCVTCRITRFRKLIPVVEMPVYAALVTRTETFPLGRQITDASANTLVGVSDHTPRLLVVLADHVFHLARCREAHGRGSGLRWAQRVDISYFCFDDAQ